MQQTLGPGRAWPMILVIAALLAACGAPQPAAQPTSAPAAPAEASAGSQLPVVATFSVLGDLVQNVGGDRVAVTTLVGAGGDAHTFEPTPADSATLVGAKVVFENGLEFEGWLDDLFAASGSSATRVVVTEGIATIAAGEHEGEAHADEAEGEAHADEAEGEAHADEHEHGEFDPHVWHDVRNAIIMVENIRAGLAAADPANAASYEANAKSYIAQLNELDTFVQSEVAQLPAERRKLVTSHDTFAYFAQRYGFTVVGTALGSVSTEVGDPAVSELAALVEEIKSAGVPAIFAENVSNPDLMVTIAREAGVALGPPLFTDALGEPGSAGATYIEMIRSNTAAIVGALKG